MKFYYDNYTFVNTNVQKNFHHKTYFEKDATLSNVSFRNSVVFFVLHNLYLNTSPTTALNSIQDLLQELQLISLAIRLTLAFKICAHLLHQNPSIDQLVFLLSLLKRLLSTIPVLPHHLLPPFLYRVQRRRMFLPLALCLRIILKIKLVHFLYLIILK